MGSKGSNTTTTSQTSSYTPNEQAAGYINQGLSTAANAAGTPYNPYTGELVAPVNAQQQQAIGNINAAYGMAQPAYNTAINYATQAGQPLGAAQIQQYMSPYTQNVVDATQAQFNNQNAQQQSQLTGNAISQGALGGNRVGVAQGTLAGQQQLAQAPVIAGLYNQGYQQALTTAQQQQQNQANAAYALGNLGSGAQNAQLQGASAQLGAGTLQQQTQQAQDQAAYQQFLNQQAYPFQTSQFLTQAIGALAPLLGGTSTGSGTTTAPSPSPWSSILGAGLAAASFLPSDERAKENIEPVGKLYDGTNIYRYNFKDDPATHIGVLAQEVEHKSPDAVAEGLGGLKLVNYERATDDAAARKHFAVGGLADDNGYVPDANIEPAQPIVPQLPKAPAASQDQDSGAGGMLKQAMGLVKTFKGSDLGKGFMGMMHFAGGGLAVPYGGSVGYVPNASIQAARAIIPQLPQAPAAQSQDAANDKMWGQAKDLAGAIKNSDFAKGFNMTQLGTPELLGSGEYVGPLGYNPSFEARGGRIKGYDLGGEVFDTAYTPDPVGAISNEIAIPGAFMRPGGGAVDAGPIPNYAEGDLAPAPIPNVDLAAPPPVQLAANVDNSGVADLFRAKEQQYGLPPGYLGRTYKTESGGGKDLYNAASGAAGPFQFMPQTAAEYGLKDPYDTAAATDAAARYAANARNILRKGLGREPTSGELYLAHQQGAGGALKLLSNPDAPASALVGRSHVALNGFRDSNPSAAQFVARWAPDSPVLAANDNGVAGPALAFTGEPVNGVAAKADLPPEILKGHSEYTASAQPRAEAPPPPVEPQADSGRGPFTGLTNPFAQSLTPQKDNRQGDVPSWWPFGRLSDATKQQLMATGFGMMASKSPFLGVAIGEGGQAGISAAQKGQELSRLADVARAQIAHYGAQTALTNQQVHYNPQIYQSEIEARAAQAKKDAADAAVKNFQIDWYKSHQGGNNLFNAPGAATPPVAAPSVSSAPVMTPKSTPSANAAAPVGAAPPAGSTALASEPQPSAESAATPTPSAPQAAPAPTAVADASASGSPASPGPARPGPGNASPAPAIVSSPYGPVPADQNGKPLMNPVAIARTAVEYMQAPIPAIAEAGRALMQTYNTMLEKGVTVDQNGNIIPTPGSLNALEQRERVKANVDLDAKLAQVGMRRTADGQGYEPIPGYNQVIAGTAGAKARAEALAGLVKDGWTIDPQTGVARPVPNYTNVMGDITRAKTGAEEGERSKYRWKEVQPEPGGPTYLMSEADIAAGKMPPGTTVFGPGAGSPPGQAAVKAAIATKQPAVFGRLQDAIADDVKLMKTQYRARQVAKERLQELQEILKTYEPGKFAQQKAGFIAGLRGVGIDVGNTDTANPEAFEKFMKIATKNVFDDVKAQGGGRILVSEIEGLTKANANPELQPGAVRAIVGQGVGLLNYEDKFFEDFMKWHNQHPYAIDTSEFEIPWVKGNPVRSYTKAAQNETPVKGEPIPEAQDRVDGRVYMTPKGGAMKWHAKPDEQGNHWESVETKH